MLDRLGQALKGRRRESQGGPEVRDRRGQDAQEELGRALEILGWQQKGVLGGAKGSERKQVLAWWPRKPTVVGREWIAQRLGMGHPTRVTRAGTGLAPTPAPD